MVQDESGDMSDRSRADSGFAVVFGAGERPPMSSRTAPLSATSERGNWKAEAIT